LRSEAHRTIVKTVGKERSDEAAGAREREFRIVIAQVEMGLRYFAWDGGMALRERFMGSGK
jgi:hypothetical protein